MSGIQSQENLLEMLKKMIDVDLPLSFPGYRTHINIDPHAHDLEMQLSGDVGIKQLQLRVWG